MSAANHMICVRFIRNSADGSGKQDDIAKITSVGAGMFKVSFKYEGAKNAKEMVMDDHQLFRWFRRTMRMVDADYRPFEEYQFDFPMMPSVTIRHCELHHHLDTILDAVEFHLDNWPFPSTHDIFDEDEEYVAEEIEHVACCEDEDDDDSDSDSDSETESESELEPEEEKPNIRIQSHANGKRTMTIQTRSQAKAQAQKPLVEYSDSDSSSSSSEEMHGIAAGIRRQHLFFSRNGKATSK